MRTLFILAVSVTLSATASAAEAPPSNTIGEAGTVGVGVQLGASHSSWSYDDRSGSQTTTAASLTPSIDVFVARGLSLGVSAPFTVWHLERRDPYGVGKWDYLTHGGFARVGYAIPLGDRAAFWPIARVGLTRTPMPEQDDPTSVIVALDPQLVVNLTKGVYLMGGIGGLQYSVTRNYAGGAELPGIRAEMSAGIGGWL